MRIKDPELLAKYREEFCAVCGTENHVVAHHLKTRGSGGDDVKENLIPLCVQHHDEVHRKGLSSFVKKYGILRPILEMKGWSYDHMFNKWVRTQ